MRPVASTLFVVVCEPPPEHEAEFNRVYDSEHAPMLAECVDGATRYRLEKSNDSRMQKYMVIYEIASPSVIESKEWQEAGVRGDWATKIRPHTTSRHHTIFKKI